MDTLAALRLQIEWGADEALLDAPQDRLAHPAAPAGALGSPGGAVPLPGVAPAPRPLPAAASAAAALAAAAPDLAALHAALAGFDGCDLRGTASSTVAPSGNPAAGLVFVGEAPGRDDDRAGTAYAGPPGALLDRVLASAGLTRGAALFTHLVPWRPPGERPPSPAEIAACLPFLHRLLALAGCRHLVLLGAAPLRTLTGQSSLRTARGRWTSADIPGLGTVPALPMAAPDLWLKSAGSRQATWTDLLALRTTLDNH